MSAGASQRKQSPGKWRAVGGAGRYSDSASAHWVQGPGNRDTVGR